MRIQHNIMAMSSYRNYTNNVGAMKKNLEKLSSGYKINRAGDDAAGLAISEKMRAQITGLKQAQNNAKSGINLVQTAEGALQEVQDMLNRMVKLAEQSANGTYDDSVDRDQLQKEFDKLRDEIDRINNSANFNGIKLFGNGGAAEETEDPTDPETISAVEATVDSANSAKLGTVSVTFADNATDEQKTALNTALKGTNGITFTTDDEGDGNWGTGDKIQLDKLPTGYTAKFVDETGTEVALTTATDIEVGSGSGKLKAGENLVINLYTTDATPVKVGTITVGKPTTGADGTGKVTFADPPAPQAEPATADFTATIAKADGKNPTAIASSKKITINGKAYTVQADNKIQNAAGQSIKDPANAANDFAGTTLDAQMAAIVADYNANAGDANYTVAYDNGTLSFTKKDGAAADAAEPTLALDDDNYDAGAVTAVTPEPEPETPDAGGAGITLQIGDTGHSYNRITVSIKSIDRYSLIDMDTQKKLEKSGGAAVEDNNGNTVTEAKNLANISVDTEANAREALGALKGMVNYISDIRGELGATQNRLDHTINNLSVMEENIQDAESTIRDTDIAEEMMAYTKNNILIQSAQAMLAQANQVPQGVLQLLQ